MFIRKHVKHAATVLAGTLVLGALSPAAFAQSALDQLKDATSGTQSTGETFDGGNGPTDAYPDGNDG